MIHFYGDVNIKVFAVQIEKDFSNKSEAKLCWLFGNQPRINKTRLENTFIGPRTTMVTPWSTNAVEITQNMAIDGIKRIEEFLAVDKNFMHSASSPKHSSLASAFRETLMQKSLFKSL